MLAALTDLVLPRTCAGCRRPSADGLCARCVPGPPPAVSWALGFPLAAAAEYTGGVRAALLAYKERDRRELAGLLARLLADAVAAVEAAAELGRPAELVPVPSSRRACRARGGDHLVRIVGRIRTRRSSAPLRIVRTVRDSAGLDPAARAANLDGAFAAGPPNRRGDPVVVVDDIATTGATLAEASRALHAAGWSVAGAAVVAVTAKRVGRDRWQEPVERSSVRMT